MYGKKRIAIENKSSIILAGGKSWIPIGKFFQNGNGLFVGKLRNVGSWDLSLNETNSVDFSFASIKEIRDYAKEIYKSELP